MLLKYYPLLDLLTFINALLIDIQGPAQPYIILYIKIKSLNGPLK